jgi:enolase
MNQANIISVIAMQTTTDQSYPAVQVTVTTANGSTGTGSVYEAFSTSRYKPSFLYDQKQQYNGFGVTTAAAIINKIISPALIGIPADQQGIVDDVIQSVMKEAGLSPYTNISSPVSIAALKAGAAANGVPLYRHIGGQGAFTIPVGGYIAASGGKRYNAKSISQGRPEYNLVSYGFSTFADAHYALWEAANAYEKLLAKKYGIRIHRNFTMAIPAGKLDNDMKLWDILTEGIAISGHAGKIGIHADVGANEYFDSSTGLYDGLFSAEKKDRSAMLDLYKKMTTDFPFVMIQDPLEQDDLEGHATLVESTGVQIIGYDLFGTDVGRIKKCINAGCVNSVLLPVCSYNTFSDVIDVVRYAKNHGIDVMPKNLAGEDMDVASYAVGFRAGAIYQGGLDPACNYLLAFEQEIGPRAKFYGSYGLKGSKFCLV